MHHISSVSYNQKDPIDNRVKEVSSNPIVLLDSTTVDLLLRDYQDLIDERYVHWFAKRFYTLSFDTIHKLASQARHDYRNSPQRLFSYLINKAYDAQG